MHRMTSPSVPAQKMGKTLNSTQPLNSTMAQTGGFGMTNKFNTTFSSPFRDTVARGILTGTGMMGSTFA